ncbi:OmpA family protein [Costertonia aggregata]|uniref:OmpA family protein n=2 Tax=Costertonia aggregata TaxID=343403 RepID=A0A7H9AUZ8_9FLAO|nr:OmpA family protein [Costertonia aggregata]
MGQNLVVNPSFEDHKSCPKFLSNFSSDIKDWSTPSRGTTDYFHSCSENMGMPNNFNGFQKTKFGEAYAGLYLYAPNDYREYIQAKLTKTLTKGVLYRVSFQISLAEASDYALKDIFVLFSDHILKIATDKTLSKSILARLRDVKTYLVPIAADKYYGDSKKWTLVSFEYKAKGTERYMSIGNFKSNSRTRKVKPKNIGPRPKRKQKGLVSYYYLDMVSIEKVAHETELVSYELDKPHIFKNVLFDFDAYTLSDVSKKEIKRVYEYLKNNTQFQICISGHTDDQGTIFYNASLARKRAKIVSDYLMELGLPRTRITWQGKGGAFPIADNTSEAGRKQNRRVEFVISQKVEPELNK